MDQAVITFDIDWAPDEVIDDVIDIMVDEKAKATWFATHPTPCLDRIRKHSDLFELGIHPNFLPGSSHGNTHEEVFSYCMKLVPEAVSMRSHSIYHSGRMLSDMAKLTQIKYESNCFLPESPNILAVNHKTSFYDFIRVPFFWSDDYELSKEAPDWHMKRLYSLSGLQVYLFHPIHVFLNTENSHRYESYKVLQSNHEFEDYKFVGKGARTALLELCNTKPNDFIKMKEVVC